MRFPQYSHSVHDYPGELQSRINSVDRVFYITEMKIMHIGLEDFVVFLFCFFVFMKIKYEIIII